jgi:hypothetical protein
MPMVFTLIVSLTVAVISTGIAWRLLRLERLRSAARVAALSAAIDGDLPSAADEFAWEEPPLEKGPALFSHLRPETRSYGPLLTAAVTVAAGVLVVVLMAMLADDDRPTPATDAQAQATEALELLSMTHTRDGAALVISGSVRNATQKTTAPLTTVVTALDAEGHLVGTSSAALPSVGPGDTRPFTVRLEGMSAVGRYRVSFRTNNGVMPHVDRRATRGSTRAAAE